MMRIARNSVSIGPANVDPASGSHQRIALSSRLVRGESEVGRLALAAGDRHGRRLCAELLVPGLDGVRPRRQALDREAAVRAGHGEKRVWAHAEVGVRPDPFFAVTGPDGSFSIKGLPPGTYTIEAWHEKFGTQTATVTIAGSESKTANFTFAAH